MRLRAVLFLCLWSLAFEARGQDVLYYHHDATGNRVAMTDETGQVVWQGDIRPFGAGTPSPSSRPLRFLGQEREPDTSAEGGLYMLGARYLDPFLGRFISPDPLPLDKVQRENPQRFNLYSYALNNPYRFHDATGFEPEPQDWVSVDEESFKADKNDPRWNGAREAILKKIRAAFKILESRKLKPSRLLRKDHEQIRSKAIISFDENEPGASIDYVHKDADENGFVDYPNDKSEGFYHIKVGPILESSDLTVDDIAKIIAHEYLHAALKSTFKDAHHQQIDSLILNNMGFEGDPNPLEGP